MCHKEAVLTIVALPRDYRDCAELLSSQHAKEEANNRQMMLNLLSNVHYMHAKVYHYDLMGKKITSTTTSYLDLEEQMMLMCYAA